ncbi:MAG: hypothetical protein ACRBCI_12870 [Cellvibrionaceae bacterium]
MRMPKIPYSRSMIEKINAIRNRMSPELKSGVRFSNPDIFKNMSAFYHSTEDKVSQRLIEALLIEAGGRWIDLLKTEEQKTRQVIKVYRGNVTLVDARSHVGIIAGNNTSVEERSYQEERQSKTSAAY